MNRKFTYSARTDEYEEHIILVCTDKVGNVLEIYYELYHSGDDVEFEGLPYDFGT